MVGSILIVSDNHLVSESFSKLLKEYQVFVEDTYEKALEIIKKEQIDIVLIYDGGRKPTFGLINEIDKLFPTLPVILLSSCMDSEKITPIMGKLFSSIFQPIDYSEVLRRVKQALRFRFLLEQELETASVTDTK